MNHLKTGNAFFAQGSYKAYKFLGNELQETGFYDMNARFYMADLGIFGQHDPLSASTLDPYGYGYNNPIMFADPSGLEGEVVGNSNLSQSLSNPTDVIITCSASAAALNELQKSVSSELKLTMDENGKVSYTPNNPKQLYLIMPSN